MYTRTLSLFLSLVGGENEVSGGAGAVRSS